MHNSDFVLCNSEGKKVEITRYGKWISTRYKLRKKSQICWDVHDVNLELQEKSEFSVYIYIYAFSRRFYPKRLTVHSSYSFYILSALAFPGNRTHDLGVASAMRYQLSYRKAILYLVLYLVILKLFLLLHIFYQINAAMVSITNFYK